MAPARDAEPRLRLAVGGGIAAVPRFAGADSYRLRLLPVIAASYGRFFFGAGGLGVHLFRDAGWRLSAVVAPSPGRKESADAHLAGLGDVDRSARAGFIVAHSRGTVSARASVVTDIGGEGHGTVGRLDVFARLRAAERLAIFAGPGITWANRQHMQTFFGVTSEQSARSGLPAFAPDSGTSSVRLSAGAVYRLDERWGLLGSASAARLTGDAADSPVTQSRTQYLFLAAAVYRVR